MNPSNACSRHRALAGWQCTVCHKLLCPDCVAEKIVHPVTMTSCCECGQIAKVLTRKFRDTQPLIDRIPGALLFPLHGEGAMFLVANSVGFALASYFPGEVLLGCIGLIIGAFFGIIRSTGAGHEMMEGATYTDIFNSVAKPFLYFAVATVVFWLPPLLQYFAADEFSFKFMAVCAVLGMMWTPVAVLGAATSTSPFILLNPVAIVGLTLRLEKDAIVYVGSWFALALAMLPLGGLAYLLYLIPIPVLCRVLAALVLLYPPLVGARISGLVLRLFGDVLGYGAVEDAQGPVLPGVHPRGVIAPERNITEHLSEGEAPKRSFEPIELPEESAPAQQFVDVPEELPREKIRELDAAAIPSLDVTLLHQLRGAMKSNDVNTSMEALKGFSVFPAAELTLRELLWLGRAAASIDENQLACDALSSAVEKEGHEIDLAKSKVLLARLLDERMNRREDAHVWMERIIVEHPDSDPAIFARDWLDRMAAGQRAATEGVKKP